ncbi:hypothetical protein ACTWJ9_33220 (plasmid) [Streptomyces sp. GDS52]|uniref:hypothetical protein n=1 Tax=Streptomyces sp. GDS52 TaxID=3406419 RepID=UPI003FD10E86
MTDTTDTEKTQTPEELLTELAQLHIRTIVPPSPKHPSAFGWQAIAGCQAAGFARALHALMEVAPVKAAEITDWFQGPFEEGPDPEEHTDWIERTVAGGDVGLLEAWITEARRLAEEAKANTEAGDKERRRMADKTPAAVCAECGHSRAGHREGDDPVTPGECTACPDDERHDYRPATDGEPTPLRWGLDDVMHGDDDTTTVLLSGPSGEPYWLELEPERAAALRESLAGPEEPAARVGEELTSGVQQCGHDDYHDPHEWHDKPHLWCPGHSAAGDASRDGARS